MATSPIRHVFVLMLENRSFDHMLGFSGIVGTDAVTGQRRPVNGPGTTACNQYKGATYCAGQPALNPMPIDPGHEFPDVLEELCGVGAVYVPGGAYPTIDNSGYVANYAALGGGTTTGSSPRDSMLGLSRSQVPVTCQLAEAFAVCDGWFASMPGPTWPNRFFAAAASAGGLDHSPTTAEIVLWSVTGFRFQHGTIYDALDGAGLPWRIYRGDSTPVSNAIVGRTKLTNIWPYTSFARDVQQSTYAPAYTFIEPAYGNIMLGTYTCGTSQHPLDDVARGEWLVKCTYEAIRNSPLWDSSLLVVTWDENGGFYDHTVPPPATAPGDTPQQSMSNGYGFTFEQCGPRVPAVVVSPYVASNVVDGRFYEHSSILVTLENLFGLQPLTGRDGALYASDSNLLRLATLASPRTDPPATLVDPAPGVTFPGFFGCRPITGCGTLPTAVEQEAVHAEAASSADTVDEPLTGNQPGFLHAALQQDLAVTPPGEEAARVERFRQVRTRQDAAAYLVEVSQRVRAAEAGTGTPGA